MDIQLQELIDKIKKDGVASAENTSAKIIAEAEAKAKSIIADAETKAESIIKNGKLETERMEKASIDAISQAGRNILISFRDGINAQLSALIESETSKAYNSDLLKTLIPETVKAWAEKDETNDLAVLLNEKSLKELESGFKASLKSEISKGLEIKADNSISQGFRIGTKDGAAYYDFSAESVAELFASYLNPKIAQIMKDAVSKGL
ncbi:MAG: V-type ATP synthase subunit E [Treponemataceae bacterium]|nr:V-type ATP synthase subunit E [Spirochaetales bacterium]MDY6031577.1 V-type ATP synthase subunit E [Treponemataceae bacterium]